MQQLIWMLAGLAIALLFLLGAPLLDLVGWSYTTGGGSPITNIHPATFVFVITGVLAVLSMQGRAFEQLKRPSLIIFSIASVAITVKAVMINMSGTNEGELSTSIVTFITPVFVVLTLAALEERRIAQVGVALRVFFVFNSLMAIAERLIGHRFIPSFLDDYTSFDRSAGLLGHPLNAAVLTGLLIVFLVMTNQRRGSSGIRMAELGLQAIAMFAFGGRSALVFTVMVLLLGSVTPDWRRGAPRASALQRMLPFLIVGAGLLLVFLPIPFVDATLERFTNDKGSGETRASAIKLLTMVSPDELLYGMRATQRHFYMEFLNTPAGFEISWISLSIKYGLLWAIPLAIGTGALLYSEARGKDRPAMFMALLFMLVTIGSLSIGSKSTLISQALVMIWALTSRPQSTKQLFHRAIKSDHGGRPAKVSRGQGDLRRDQKRCPSRRVCITPPGSAHFLG